MFRSKIIYLTGLIIIGLIISPISVLAIESDSQTEQRLQTRTQAEEGKRQASEDKILEFCQRATDGLTERSDRFSDNQALLIKFYSQIQTALQTLINNKQAKGESTTELTAYQTQLDTKISALVKASTAYQQSLSAVQTMDCTENRQTFGQGLRTSNQALQTLVRARQDLHTFVRTKLYPMVNKMRLRTLTPAVQ